jgi:DNA-binding winged helix-turn-helix (wHTH) protein
LTVPLESCEKTPESLGITIEDVRARFADCILDSGSRELSRGGESIDLTPKAFALLEALVNAYPEAVSKQALYEVLWPGVFVETGNLHTLIGEIRSAIADGEHQIIRTVHRFGYALASEVFTDESPAAILILGARQIPLHEGETIIGREIVGSPDVSRAHARITVHSGKIRIEDLDSKNGTWVAGKRITSAELHDGDEIILGRTRAVVRLTPTDVTMTAPPIVANPE